jgi:hypothetical protein
MDLPSGEGDAKYSDTYRSAVTAIGVPPSAGTRYTSFIPAMSPVDEEK